MAVGWYSVLQMVPWTEVINNAPRIAEAAKKLWGSVSKKEPTAPDLPEAGKALPPEARALAELRARLDATEAAMAELHQQMLGSAKLIEELARQNTQLVQRIEANRVRVRWLTAAAAVFGLVALLALFGIRVG